jgi:hypothetical protein
MNSIIKLSNGETIIAEIVHQDDKTTSVLEPLQLIIEESEDTGRPVMVALNWVPLTKKINLVELKTNHVVAVADCDEEVNNYYIKSLAVLKGDKEKLKEILEREREELDYDEEEDESDPWMNKFSKPIDSSNTTSTMVH